MDSEGIDQPAHSRSLIRAVRVRKQNHWNELGAFMRTDVLCTSVLIVASGPRVKLAGRKNALTPPSPRPSPTPR